MATSEQSPGKIQLYTKSQLCTNKNVYSKPTYIKQPQPASCRYKDVLFLFYTSVKVDSTSFQVFWICKLWKERTKNQPNITTKFVYDTIAKFVLVQKRQLFCHQLLPWQRYLMIVQTYFWASKAHILKTNLVTPNFFFPISFFVTWNWNYVII